MERKLLVAALLLGVCLVVPNTASAWSDGFEAYNLGSVIAGQGGWEGWAGNSSSAQEYIVSTPVHTGEKSLEVSGPEADVVQPFAYDSGTWELSGWQYIPSSQEAGNTYYILMNSYPTGLHWASQLKFNLDPNAGSSGTGTVIEDHFQKAEGSVQNTLDIIRDQWIEIKHTIDLDNDWVTITYGGQLLAKDEWKAGGTATLAALDLYGQSGTVYYDDFNLTPEPTTLALVGIGGLMMIRRRRRKA